MSNSVDVISKQQKMHVFLLEAARSRCLANISEVITAELSNRIDDETAIDQIAVYVDWYKQFKESMRSLP